MLSRILLTFAALPLLAEEIRPANPLTVHEWGTFTSVAAATGEELPWSPFNGPVDLPCFVHRLGLGGVGPKMFPMLIRMETPVLYFYAPAALTLSVRVDFPQGVVTEWYPRATNRPRPGNLNRIEWANVEVRPGENLKLPVTQAPNHYFAARETDAAPLRVGEEQEKLLFYRGVGGFGVPLHPRYEEQGKLRVRNSGGESIAAFLFERRGDRVGFQRFSAGKGETVLDPVELTADLPSVLARLEETLVEFGLYRKEASAMLATWKDSWFEEGSRLIYIVPRTLTDAVLPLQITPSPRELARVFVGRIELLAPDRQQILRQAVADQHVPNLVSFGRFLSPFADILRANGPALQEAASRLSQPAGSASCVQ
jgi:hypothetical protein